jgi:hypothetical protein
MKLEDKIRPHALLWDCYNDEPEKYNHTNKLIKIAEDFAIGFAEWLLNERTGFNRETEIKELLEMYKKEKGL